MRDKTLNKTIEYPVRKDPYGNLMRFRKAYDNGGKTVDRYTVTFEIYNEHTGKWDIFTEGWNVNAPDKDSSYNRIYCLGMSGRPFHPQGFGQSSLCVEGQHLGKRVKFSKLPEEVKKCILQYLGT
jgi:hypothetical protein